MCVQGLDDCTIDPNPVLSSQVRKKPITYRGPIMKKHYVMPCIVLTALQLLSGCGSSVKFEEYANRIDVRMKGELFTSYLHAVDPNQPLIAEGRRLAKPVLSPVYSPSGVLMTRAYPFFSVEGEAQDHPHHMGVYFTIDINEEKFWGNSRDELPSIQHIAVTKKRTRGKHGHLHTLMHWVNREGRVMLEEERHMVFSDRSREGLRAIDMTINLTAQAQAVVIGDTKEGLMAVRVAPWLNEKNGTGRYLSSNGEETEKNVWGKRAKWMRLQGEKDDQTYGIAILNHPDSVNYPNFWHARGYGCFSANPLGQGAFEKSRKVANAQDLNLRLEPGVSACFRYRLLFYEGARTMEEIESEFVAYAGAP